jgi:hypothetical protein
MIIVPMFLPSSSNEEYCSNCQCKNCVAAREAANQPMGLYDKIILGIVWILLAVVVSMAIAMLLDFFVLNYAILDWLF